VSEGEEGTEAKADIDDDGGGEFCEDEVLSSLVRRRFAGGSIGSSLMELVELRSEPEEEEDDDEDEEEDEDEVGVTRFRYKLQTSQ
jgi:hypothetical protein